MEPFLIVGAGHQGLAMAGHLALNGEKCYLWNRTKEHISSIINKGEIECQGIVSGIAKIERASDDIREVLQKCIMIATPSLAHRDIAKLIAPYVDSNYTIILNPGRTYGVIDFKNSLKIYGCKELPCIAETQTIVYTCRKIADNSVYIHALKSNIPIAGIKKEDTEKAFKAIPVCIKNRFVPVDSFMYTSLGNIGMILHCAPVLMNIGWIESNKTEFKYYYDGITPTIALLLEKMDEERLSVAEALGYKIESLNEWLYRTYNAKGKNLYEQLQNNIYYRQIDAPQTINHRYIEEDVPNGLVPIESTAIFLGMKTPIISLVIDMANTVMEKDYRVLGRKYFGNKKV